MLTRGMHVFMIGWLVECMYLFINDFYLVVCLLLL